jgi:excisionase family DNA binding protein
LVNEESGEMHGDPDDVYLTADEVCAWLNVTKDWLYDVVQQGRIPFDKFGRQLRFHKGELREWIAIQRAAAAKRREKGQTKAAP